MEKEIFANNLKTAFFYPNSEEILSNPEQIVNNAEQALGIISEYFGAYDSYVKKDVISLLAHQRNFDDMESKGVLLENTIEKNKDKVSDELDVLIEKLIREKEQINPENYEEIFSEIIRYRDMARIADEQRFEVGLAFCERFYSYYNDDLKHRFNEGIRIENSDSDRVIKNNLMDKNNYAIIRLFSKVKDETKIIYEGINKNSERLRLQKLLSKNKIDKVLIELSPKLEKKKFSSLEWEILELRCKLRKLTQKQGLGTITTREFIQERHKLYTHLTTLIFHKEEEKQKESKSMMEKLLQFFKLK